VCKHPNIIKLVSAIHSNASLTLVFEYMDHDLKNYMDACEEIGGMDSYTIKSFSFQLLQGLAYLHKLKVVFYLSLLSLVLCCLLPH
jgi:serine/threonine protein kinase